MEEQTPPDGDHAFASLRGAEFMVLTTYRRSGEPVPTTVWFAEAGGKIYLTTSRDAGKIRRLVANPAVQLAPSDRVGNVHGPAVPGVARLLRPAESDPAMAALRAKYADQYESFTQRMDSARPPGSRVFVEVSPG